MENSTLIILALMVLGIFLYRYFYQPFMDGLNGTEHSKNHFQNDHVEYKTSIEQFYDLYKQNKNTK